MQSHLVDVTMIRTAAPPEDVQALQMAAFQHSVVTSKRLGVASIEFNCFVQFSMAHLGSVCAKASNAIFPWLVSIDDGAEVAWMRAIDHEVRRVVACGRVNLLDRVAEVLAGR